MPTKVLTHTHIVQGHISPLDNDFDLLGYYLSLSPLKRKELFTDTAGAADRIGVSQRTIQSWVDAGLVRAIPIGKKFQVQLDSLLSHVRGHVSNRRT